MRFLCSISRLRYLRVIVVCLASTAAVPARVAAQGIPATIAGQVVDETGGVLPGVTVALKESKTGRERVVLTDATGRFVVDQLAPGSYTVTTTLTGFEDLERSAVDVGGGETTRVNLVMKVSAFRDAVTVRGTALNFASSIAGKRSADGVVDMFNADEIGRLPDKNIGETLNRIPGVSMLLEKGEGRFVQIRGVSPRLNNVTINGLSLGNGETESGGRLVPLDVIGGELLSGVQVLKTPTPDMDGQGIGGTLNLTTKQPFDFEKPLTLLVSSRGGGETISSIPTADTKEVPYALDATLTGKIEEQPSRLAGRRLVLESDDAAARIVQRQLAADDVQRPDGLVSDEREEQRHGHRARTAQCQRQPGVPPDRRIDVLSALVRRPLGRAPAAKSIRRGPRRYAHVSRWQRRHRERGPGAGEPAERADDQEAAVGERGRHQPPRGDGPSTTSFSEHTT